jgi:peptidyl-tRNA hydrolase
MAAQAGHAYLDCYHDCITDDRNRADEYKIQHGIKICLKARNLDELLWAYEQAQEAGLHCALITDLGYTQFEGKPTITAVGIGPARQSECGAITKRFQLWRD